MKHILHKNVSGKVGADGEKYFQIYISFTENRISYRLKSQLVTRPVTKKEFDSLKSLYNGKISDLLAKEREIVFYCRDRNMQRGELNREKFRINYIALTQCMINMVRETKAKLPISDWSIPGISWELIKDIDLANNLPTMKPFDGFTDTDFFELEVFMLDYQRERRRRSDLNGLFLVYDWFTGTLEEDFRKFLVHRTNDQIALRLMDLLELIIEKI